MSEKLVYHNGNEYHADYLIWNISKVQKGGQYFTLFIVEKLLDPKEWSSLRSGLTLVDTLEQCTGTAS